MATEDCRAHALAIMNWLIAMRDHIHYAQARPMATASFYEQDLVTLFKGGHTIAPDCSEMITDVCRWAGLHDPNGMGFNGFGNSASMWDHLPHYTNPSKAHVGAIVVFGQGGSQHAAMIKEPSPDPILFSHGSASGPISVSLSALTKAIGSPSVTLLDIGAL
jgi:hypothetical protein